MNTHAFDIPARSFFDDFVTAFATLSGQAIAQRYIAPYVAMHARAERQVFVEHHEIGAYFQRVVDAYAAQGCTACRYFDLAVVPLGHVARVVQPGAHAGRVAHLRVDRPRGLTSSASLMPSPTADWRDASRVGRGSVNGRSSQGGGGHR
jgi:hypothetical protein